MANDIFLKKVYDQYLNTDYEYGVSNLNPKREISPGTGASDNDISKKIEDEVRRQFNLIKEDAKQFLNFTTPKPSTDTEKEIEKTGSILSTNHNSTIKTVPKLGGSLYDPGLEETPLVDEIDDLIFKLGLISAVTDPTKDKPYDDIGEGANPANQITLPNGCCLCHGGSGGGKSSKTTGKGSLKDAFNNMVPVDQEDIGFLNEGDEIESNTMMNHFENIWDDNPTIPPTGNENKAKTPEEEWSYPIGCMLENLEILKSILAVLKVLQTIKRTVLRVLKIGIPLIKVCARCAAAWTCPPSAGEAMQLILEKVNSILIGVTGELLQMLWDMLQLDCISNMALELKDQILQILAGGIELWNDMTNESWTSLNDEYSSEIEDMKKDWNDAIAKRKKDAEKRGPFWGGFNSAELWNNIGSSWSGFWSSIPNGVSGKIDSFVNNISSGLAPQDWEDHPEDVKDSNEYSMARSETALNIDISVNCEKTKNALENIDVVL